MIRSCHSRHGLVYKVLSDVTCIIEWHSAYELLVSYRIVSFHLYYQFLSGINIEIERSVEKGIRAYDRVDITLLAVKGCELFYVFIQLKLIVD